MISFSAAPRKNQPLYWNVVFRKGRTMLNLIVKSALFLLFLALTVKLCCALVCGVFCMAALVGLAALAIVPIVLIIAIARAV